MKFNDTVSKTYFLKIKIFLIIIKIYKKFYNTIVHK